MTYDNELTLISEAPGSNALGDKVTVDVPFNVLCGVKSIGRREFYSAAVAGLQPEITFVMHKYEYDGQKVVIFEGIRYEVIRTYSDSTEEIELTCKSLVGGG